MCVRRDATRDQAEADGFAAEETGTASDADVICLLVPDDVIPLLGIAVRPSSCVIVASGYALAFGRLQPAGDAGLVAPRMLGPEVRRCYEEGAGFITALGVHHDASGAARDRVLAIALAIGTYRLLREVGYAVQSEFHSPTSQYGQLTRRGRYDHLDFLTPMRALVDDIENGRFADQWDAERDAGYPTLTELKEQYAGPAIREFEADLRPRLGPGAEAPSG